MRGSQIPATSGHRRRLIAIQLFLIEILASYIRTYPISGRSEPIYSMFAFPWSCLQDFVDQHLISTGQQPAIKPVMGGTFVQQIICR